MNNKEQQTTYISHDRVGPLKFIPVYSNHPQLEYENYINSNFSNSNSNSNNINSNGVTKIISPRRYSNNNNSGGSGWEISYSPPPLPLPVPHQQQFNNNNISNQFLYPTTSTSPLPSPSPSPKQYYSSLFSLNQQQTNSPVISSPMSLQNNYHNYENSSSSSSDDNEVFNINKRKNNLKQQKPSPIHPSHNTSKKVNNTSNIHNRNNSNSNTRKYKKQQRFLDDSGDEDEFYDTNSDFSKLSVSNKEDLEVCLSVLKKEIHQFKNLSNNLHQRLITLEKGVGDERNTMNLSPTLVSSNQLANSGSSQTTSSSIVTNDIDTNELISNCLAEIHRLLEKQHQYEALLAQREQFWEMEIESIRIKLQDQNTNSSSSSLPSSSLSMLRDEYFNEADEVGSSSSSSSPSSSTSSSVTSSCAFNQQQLEKLKQIQQIQQYQQQQHQQHQSKSIFKRAYLFVFGPQSNIWRKIVVITIVIIVWPVVSHFLLKAFRRWLEARRARNSHALTNQATNTITSASQLSNAATQFSITKKKKKTKNISAPDIVKAFIQGVSTGDGGSNNNITNNAITSLSNTLNSLTPTSLISGSSANANGISNGLPSLVSNTGSGINSSTANTINSVVNGTGSTIAQHLAPSPSPSSIATLSPTTSNTSLLSNSKDRIRDSSQRFMVKLVKNILKGDNSDS